MLPICPVLNSVPAPHPLGMNAGWDIRYDDAATLQLKSWVAERLGVGGSQPLPEPEALGHTPSQFPQ